MKLTTEQSKALFERFGCYVTTVCDKCSQVLGPIRFTRQNESGEWCSRECRGDAARTVRRGGRPRKYRTVKQAHTAKVELQRIRRARPNEAKTPSELMPNKGLADAKMASHVVAPMERDLR
jgi:hypothetical protein